MANLTLLDVAKRSGNDATVGIVESMIQSNPLLAMIPTKQITGAMYKYQRRVGLPTVGFTGFNQGIASSKSRIEQIVVETKILKGLSKVDRLLAEAYKDGVNAFRAIEDIAFAGALANAYNENCYYGDSTSVLNEFDGIKRILPSIAGTCVSSTGSSANVQTSMYFWSFTAVNTKEGKIQGVEMPLANGNGIRTTDLGLQLVADADSNDFVGYVTDFTWQPGLAVYDTKSVGRLANIDSTHKPTVALINSVLTAMHPFRCDLITCSPTVFGYVQELKGTTAAGYQPWVSEDLFKRARFFDGIPIMIDDNITQTEAVVS